MIEWHIQSRAHVCKITGRPFSHGEAYHTVLLDAKTGFERLDLCSDAFKDQSAEILARQGLVSHWRGIYEPPPAVAPDAIQKEDAESLLRKLLEQPDDRYAGATYILAVMLERKRVLRVKAQSRESGRRVFVYEHPRSGDLFTIADPDLQLSQLEQVQRDVSQLLEYGIPSLQPDPRILSAGFIEEPFNLPSDVETLAPEMIVPV
ncbi:MAG: hypothetical protein EXS25_00850 [Pedosphaera sp.]|nr:hypothetical protein [Pedosphaera sp.]